MDRIMLRKGGALAGKVLNKQFTIKTDIGTLSIPTKAMAQMLINVPAYNGSDRIYTCQSQYTGDVMEKTVELKNDDTGEKMSIAIDSILVVFWGL